MAHQLLTSNYGQLFSVKDFNNFCPVILDQLI